MSVLLVTWLTVASQFSGGVTPSVGLVTASASDSHSALAAGVTLDLPIEKSDWGLRAGVEAFSDLPPAIGDGNLERTSLSGAGLEFGVERVFHLGPRGSAYVALSALAGQLWAGWFLTGNAPVCPPHPEDVYEDCTLFSRAGIFPRISAGLRVDLVEFGTDFTYARLMGIGVKMFTLRLGVHIPFS